MDPNETLFFDQSPQALPLYLAFRERVLDMVPGARIKVQKTQISFSNRYLFSCVSFLPARKKKDRPPVWLTVTFGLDHPVRSPRIDIVTQAQPNRWTHHILISRPEELDGELMGWVREAAEFSAQKR